MSGPKASIGLWPKGIVPYVIDSSISDPEPILKAMKEWEKAGIQFRPRMGEADFISILKGNPKNAVGVISEWIGRKGGEQKITMPVLNAPWYKYAHELGHALGLFHEFKRKDRDKYLTIHWGNIPPSRKHNYSKPAQDSEDLFGFDIESIMMHVWNADAINPKRATITWKADPNFKKFGTSVLQTISPGDLRAVHYLYFERGPKDTTAAAPPAPRAISSRPIPLDQP
jgi:hypothetical protein